MKIAVLGWGSLRWEQKRTFDSPHQWPWNDDGPVLPLEFSRKSSSRSGALTLAIDPARGTPIRCAYAVRERYASVREATKDLASLERTVNKNIGCVACSTDAAPYARPNDDPMIEERIRDWARHHDFDAVIYTALPPSEWGADFFQEALAYLRTGSRDLQREAHQYLSNAPDSIRTPLGDTARRRRWYRDLTKAHRLDKLRAAASAEQSKAELQPSVRSDESSTSHGNVVSAAAPEDRRWFAALRNWLNEDVADLRAGKSDALDLEDVLAAEKAALGNVTQRAHPIGLALSGGGIRSATFCLGVLQALARGKRLGSFDYLSTVSGGGYIGSWLSAWILRSNLKTVEDALARCEPSSGVATESTEPLEITRLRKLSNYLSPRLGLLSLDSLTLIATWLRNVLLNLLLLLATAGTVLMLPRLLVEFPDAPYIHAAQLGGFATALAVVVLLASGYNLWQQATRGQGWLTNQAGVFWSVILPALVAALLATVWVLSSSYSSPSAGEFALITLSVLLFVAVPWALIAALVEKTAWKRIGVHAAVYALAFFVALIVLLFLLDRLHAAWALPVGAEKAVPRTRALGEAMTFGPAGVVLSFAAGIGLFIGLTGSQYMERSREWWSRVVAWLTALAVGWLIVAALGLFVPAIAMKAWAEMPGWFATIVGSGWIGTAIVTVLGARSHPTSPLVTAIMRRAVRIAAVLFSVGLIVVIAWLTNWVLLASADLRPGNVNEVASGEQFSLEVKGKGAEIQTRVEHTDKKPAALSAYANQGFRDLDALIKKPPYEVEFGGSVFQVSHLEAMLLLLLGGVLLLSLRVDINTFSLHNLYKNRLVRCYLGSSHGDRRPARFTGFDDDDDIPLASIGRQRPFHLVNAAINITYGKNLAWQERMAGPFTFSGLHCGTALPRSQGDDSLVARDFVYRSAYRPSGAYSSDGTEKDAFTLGMAMTTSGAAVSPNHGPGTTPSVAFLLTLFNGRIGRWAPNPFQRAWESSSPRMSIAPLLQELFGFADEQRRFVYISDGGFFDNLGIYELVRRRCSLIVVVDASADPQRTFGDLGEAIRKCRMDLGVEITFDDKYLLEAKDEKMRAAEGFARARIDYGIRCDEGTLLYIKPTLRLEAGEPADVLAYAAQHPTFPHQTTIDQFFSESQFESYRKLGAFIAARCLDRHGGELPSTELQAIAPGVDAGRSDDWFQRAVRWCRKALGWCFGASIALVTLMGLISYRWITNTWLPDPVALLMSPSSAARVWLWIDFVLIASYSSFFIIGYRLATLRLFASPTMRIRVIVFSILVTLAVAGAAADLMENLIALADLGADSERAGAVAAAMQPWTRAKLWLFGLNAVLTSIGLIWARFKPRHQR